MKLTVNGVPHSIAAQWQDESLLTVLREHLGLTGSRFSCGIGQCGACMVHIDGRATASCIVPARQAMNRKVKTIEGVAGDDGSLHPIQQAWIDENVPQCGYCQSGQIMSALGLLEHSAAPTDTEIDQAMDGNLCRCGTYQRIKTAIKKAALIMRDKS